MLILAIVLGLVFLVVLLLSIPIDLAFSYERGKGERGEGSQSRMRIGWLFGLIGKELGGKKKAQDEKAQDEKVQEKKPRKRNAKKGRMSVRGPLAMFAARGFSGRLFLLARRLARSIQVRDVDVEFQMGTGDPAETGQLFALIGPGLALARSSFSPNIRIDPNFVEETFRGHARGAVRAYPIRLIPPLIAFPLSPKTLQGAWAIRRARKG